MNDEYSSDKAITSSSDDAFNRKAFSERLAEALYDAKLGDGYVVGLYSPWGYGKTSILNMVEEVLSAKQEANHDIVVVKFNPWRYTDYSIMISGLFEELAEAIDASITKKSEKVGNFLKKYGSAVQPLALSAGVANVAPGEAAKGIGNLLSNASLDELKKRIEFALDASKKKVVVIIDDVDRLDKDEIFQLFKIIKIVIDFKNVSYIIAFDDEIVSKALSTRFGPDKEAGKDFIDKIVQVPINVPVIEKEVLMTFIFNGIDELLNKHEIEILQDEIDRFRRIFDAHIAPLMINPRLANRYLNSLKFIIPLVGKEINPSDLLIIEGFRLLFTEPYKRMRTNKEILTQGSMNFWSEEQPDRIKDVVKDIVGNDTNVKHITAILNDLFPVVANAYSQNSSSHTDKEGLSEAKSIASSDYFDRYFTYGIPLGDISDVKIASILSQEKNTIVTELESLVSDKGAKIVVKKMRAFESGIKNDNDVAYAVTKLSHIFDDPMSFGLSETPREEIAKMLAIFVQSRKMNSRYQLVKQILDDSNDASFLSYFIKWISIESDDSRPDPLLNGTLYKKFKVDSANAVKRILTKSNKLLVRKDASHITHLYQMWAEGLGQKDLTEYIQNVLKTPKQAEDLLMTYLNLWSSGSSQHYANLDDANYAFLIKSIDPEILYNVLQKKYSDLDTSEDSGFSNREWERKKAENSQLFRKAIVRQFVYRYKASLKKESDSDQLALRTG
jgi:predicted KAP-like P-loop ATPase